MKKISEAKKSELIRRDEAVMKGEKRLKEANDKLKKDSREFSLLMDKRLAEFKKEKVEFENEVRRKKNELNKEAIKLETITNNQKREQIAVATLKIKYNKGFNENKVKGDVLKESLLELKSRVMKTEEKEGDLVNREKIVDGNEVKILQRIKYSKSKLEEIEKQSLVLEEQRSKIEELGNKVEKDQEEVLQVKVSFTKGMLENDIERSRLRSLSKSLDKKQTMIIEERESLEVSKADLKRESIEAESKKQYAEKKIEELDTKINKYFQIKVKAEDGIEKSRELSLSVGRREKEVAALKKVVEEREKEIAQEKIKLSEWRDSLTSLKIDLRDRQRLISIEAREVKEKQRIVQKIRKEIYKTKED